MHRTRPVTAPDGWTATVSNKGPIPLGLKPNDDPAQPNLTFTYHGPTMLGGLGLGNFWAASSVGTNTVTEFAGQNVQTSSGQLDRNLVETIAPGIPSTTPPPGVPEPTTLALAGIGLPLLAAVRRFRAKK